MTGKHRPTTLAEMEERSARLFSAEHLQQGLSLKLRPTDVVITPFSKCGTTWTQQIVHTLRTRGDMDFDDISRVVPWIEVSPMLGIDLDAPQKAEPRAFKSHLGWDLVPKGGRYIVVVRDPGDAAVSLFKFQEGWFLEPGCVSIDEFLEHSFLTNRRYYQHLESWWPHRHDHNVLLLAYERMLQDPSDAISRIAAFIGVPLDAELMTLTLEHSSVGFMLQHKDRFDDALLRDFSEAHADLPPGSDSAKVRVGKRGGRAALSAQAQSKLAQVWREEITASLGYSDYEALIADVV